MSIDEKAAAIFHQALELAAGDRSSFIEDACGTDEALRKEVLSLLEAADESDGYFDALSKKIGITALAGDKLQNPSGRVIGNWRLDRIIGRGGMGAVYLADRADGQFEQRAALKILPFGLDTDIARIRFTTERQILANLEHANIARLLDGGVTDDGLPYFVMEYIDGLSIDLYCDRHRLNLESRIRLFAAVLAAVSHAHSQLIVHRDLKPSNVLVTDDGTVKLLDFGVAKTLADNPTAGETRELSVAVTPEYAAPEQLRGGRISTATDVYALGLLLFKLLVGSNPRSTTATDSIAQIQQLATEDAPRPSDFVAEQAQPDEVADISRHRDSTLAVLQRELRGDLDNILGKATAVDADDRYASVRELSADLERFLNDEPVLARAPTLGYRMGKFVRRHQGGVLGAALTLLALVAATVVTAWQMVEANRQRDIAIYQQQRVQASNEFYSLLMEEMGDVDFTSVELLDQGWKLLESQFGSEQPFMASVLFEVSRRYGSLGERGREAQLLRQVERIAREHADDDLLAATLCRMARINQIQEPDLAAGQFAEGNAIYDRLAAPSIDTSMECLRTAARVEVRNGNEEEALNILMSAKELLDNHPMPGTSLRGILLNEIAFRHYNAGRSNEAIDYLDRVIELLDETGRGTTLGYQRVAANRAVALQSVGRTPESLEAFDDLVQRMRTSGFRGRGSAALLAQYGDQLMTVGRVTEAETIFTEGLALAESANDADNAAYLNVGIAKVHLANKSHDLALVQLDAAQSLIDGDARAARELAGIIRNIRTKVFRSAGNLDAAAREADALLEDLGYPDIQDAPGIIISALIECAEVRKELGDYTTAEALTDDLIVFLQKRTDPNAQGDVHLGRAHVQRAEIRMGSGNMRGAVPDLELAIPHLVYALGEDHSETTGARERLASALAAVE